LGKEDYAVNGKEQLAFNAAKEIVIAKLSQSSPSVSNAAAGKGIGEMFEAIYEKLLQITSNE